MYGQSLNFRNTDGLIAYISIERITLRDIHVENITINNIKSFDLEAHSLVDIDGFTIKNATDKSTQLRPFISTIMSRDSQVNLRNLVVEDSTIDTAQALFYTSATNNSQLLIENLTFNDIVLSNHVAMIGYGIFSNVTITDISACHLISHDDSEDYNSLVWNDYSSVGLAPNITQSFSNFVMEQSNITMLSLTKADHDTNVIQTFTLSNATYKDSVSPQDTELVKFFEMATVGTYSIEFNDITFKNLSFSRNSKLMHFQQQLENAIVISNLEVSDVTFAGITVEAFEISDYYNFTHIQINNMSAWNVNGNSRSLFNIYTGARLEVNNSTFHHIQNIDKGAVLNAEATGAFVKFRS